MSDDAAPVPHGSLKTAALLRRERRRRVADLMVECLSAARIERIVSEQFGVSARMVRKDMRRVRQVWEIEDRDAAKVQTAKLLRRLDLIGEKAIEKGNLGVAALVEAQRMRFLEKFAGRLGDSDSGSSTGSLPWSRVLKTLQEESEKETVKRIPARVVDDGA